MSSEALNEWSGSRKRHLQHLWELKARAALPWQERQICSALIMRLATEFQGFARDLHDEAVEFLGVSVSAGNARVASALHAGLAANRILDKGNANADALGKDFSRLGFIFWKALDVDHPKSSNEWRRELTKLVEMRNALAHDDPAKIGRLRSDGYVVDDARVRRWHGNLDSLALAMDDVVSRSLATLLGTDRPW